MFAVKPTLKAMMLIILNEENPPYDDPLIFHG